jgi:type IV pilus assembly protein PilW
MHIFHSARKQQGGFTLVELMVASAIGLAILAAMATLFLSNTKAQGEIERANRQVENGRYAMQLIGADLRSAGYLGEFNPAVLDLPTAVPDPCSTDLAAMRLALPMHVQGYDNSSGSLTCLADEDVKAGTDVLVVRRVASCESGTANCDAIADGGPYFQASLCDSATELGSSNTSNQYRLDAATSSLTLHQHNCTATAAIRRYLTRIYFISNHDKAGDNVPTLKRADLVSSAGVLSWVVQPQIDGVENLQIEYGIDTDADGAPDLYSAAPAGANGCATTVCAIANWNAVVAIKLSVLARASDRTAGYDDTKQFTMGLNADGTANTTSATHDSYKRHLFQSLAYLPNPAGRRIP